MKGEPDVLVYDGHLTFDNQTSDLKPVEFEQLRALLRSSDAYSLRNTKHAFLETGGQFNVVKFDEDDKDFAIMVIDDGAIEHRVLESHDLTTNWLKDELKELGYTDHEDILYAEWSQETGLYAVAYDEVTPRKILIDG